MSYILDNARRRCSPGGRRISAKGKKPIQCARRSKTQATLYKKYLAAKRQARALGISVQSNVAPTSPALRSAYENLLATIYYATK